MESLKELYYKLGLCNAFDEEEICDVGASLAAIHVLFMLFVAFVLIFTFNLLIDCLRPRKKPNTKSKEEKSGTGDGSLKLISCEKSVCATTSNPMVVSVNSETKPNGVLMNSIKAIVTTWQCYVIAALVVTIACAWTLRFLLGFIKTDTAKYYVDLFNLDYEAIVQFVAYMLARIIVKSFCRDTTNDICLHFCLVFILFSSRALLCIPLSLVDWTTSNGVGGSGLWNVVSSQEARGNKGRNTNKGRPRFRLSVDERARGALAKKYPGIKTEEELVMEYVDDREFDLDFGSKDWADVDDGDFFNDVDVNFEDKRDYTRAKMKEELETARRYQAAVERYIQWDKRKRGNQESSTDDEIASYERFLASLICLRPYCFGIIRTNLSCEEMFDYVLESNKASRFRDIVFDPVVRVTVRGKTYVIKDIEDVGAVREAVKDKEDDRKETKATICVRDVRKPLVTNNVIFGSSSNPHTVTADGKCRKGELVEGPQCSNGLNEAVAHVRDREIDSKPKFVTFSELRISGKYKSVGSDASTSQTTKADTVMARFQKFYRRRVMKAREVDEDDLLDAAWEAGIKDPTTGPKYIAFESVDKMHAVYNNNNRTPQSCRTVVFSTIGLTYERLLMMLGYMGNPTPLVPLLHDLECSPDQEALVTCPNCETTKRIDQFFEAVDYQPRTLYGTYCSGPEKNAPLVKWFGECMSCRHTKRANRSCRRCGRKVGTSGSFVDGVVIPLCKECSCDRPNRPCSQHGGKDKEEVVWKPVLSPLSIDCQLSRSLNEIMGDPDLVDYKKTCLFIRYYRSSLRQNILTKLGRCASGHTGLVVDMIKNNKSFSGDIDNVNEDEILNRLGDETPQERKVSTSGVSKETRAPKPSSSVETKPAVKKETTSISNVSKEELTRMIVEACTQIKLGESKAKQEAKNDKRNDDKDGKTKSVQFKPDLDKPVAKPSTKKKAVTVGDMSKDELAKMIAETCAEARAPSVCTNQEAGVLNSFLPSFIKSSNSTHAGASSPPVVASTDPCEVIRSNHGLREEMAEPESEARMQGVNLPVHCVPTTVVPVSFGDYDRPLSSMESVVSQHGNTDVLSCVKSMLEEHNKVLDLKIERLFDLVQRTVVGCSMRSFGTQTTRDTMVSASTQFASSTKATGSNTDFCFENSIVNSDLEVVGCTVSRRASKKKKRPSKATAPKPNDKETGSDAFHECEEPKVVRTQESVNLDTEVPKNIGCCISLVLTGDDGAKCSLCTSCVVRSVSAKSQWLQMEIATVNHVESDHTENWNFLNISKDGVVTNKQIEVLRFRMPERFERVLSLDKAESKTFNQTSLVNDARSENYNPSTTIFTTFFKLGSHIAAQKAAERLNCALDPITVPTARMNCDTIKPGMKIFGITQDLASTHVTSGVVKCYIDDVTGGITKKGVNAEIAHDGSVACSDGLGPGSSGTLMWIKGNGNYVPFGLHFGGNPPENYCYSLLNTSVRMTPAMKEFITSLGKEL